MPKKSFKQTVAKKIRLYVITVILVVLSNNVTDLGPSNRRTDTSRLDTELDSQKRDTISRNIICSTSRRNEVIYNKEKGIARSGGVRDPPKNPIFENHESTTDNRKLEIKYFHQKIIHRNDPQLEPINKQTNIR